MKNENNKIKSIILVSIIAIISLLIGLGSGYLLFNQTTKETKKTNNSEIIEKEESNENSNVLVSDKLIVNLYEQGMIYYINNGEIYILSLTQKDNSKWFGLTHSGCIYNNSTAYCTNNPEYSKVTEKVEGLNNVKRIKQFNKPKASDESFQVYAIDNDGNVYFITNKVASKIETLSNVEDLLYTDEFDSNTIIALLKDGTQKTFQIK